MEDQGRKTALDLIMGAGERPKVASRGDGLLSPSEVLLQERNESIAPVEGIEKLTHSLENFEEQLAALPKNTGISAQLSSDLLEQLTEHLSQAGISREVWLEAAIAVALERADLMQRICAEAKQRHLQRQEVKKQKSALTRLKNAFS